MGACQEEVFGVLQEEREYQQRLWGPTMCGGQHSVTEMLVYIKSYTEEALHIVAREAAPDADDRALHIIRKIGALAVATMEQHGALGRGSVSMKEQRKKHGIKEGG